MLDDNPGFINVRLAGYARCSTDRRGTESARLVSYSLGGGNTTMRPGLGWMVFAALCVTAALLAVLLPDVLRVPELPEPLDPKAVPAEPSASEAYGRVPPEWRERHYFAVQEAEPAPAWWTP